jgi:hypothetical protein
MSEQARKIANEAIPQGAKRDMSPDLHALADRGNAG